jgi:hypothetical protein
MKRRLDLTRPDAAFTQAVALRNEGNLSAAEKIYRTLLKQNPNHFRTLFNLAELLLHAGRHEEAIRSLRKALNQEPNSAAAHAMLATALRNLDRYDEALERAGRAIALNPDFAEAHSALGGALSELGRYDDAGRALARAIELAPDLPYSYYQLGYVTRWNPRDPRLAALEVLAQKSGSLSRDQQVYLHFALAKAYADCGEHDRAFQHQMQGGAIKRRTLAYDEASSLRQFDELCRALDAEWMRRQQGFGDPSPLPVFILGMPRSGSTLVEQILAGHPQVRALGERSMLEDSISRICSIPSPRLAPQWSRSELRKLGALYLAAAQQNAPASATRVTDKVLANFRFTGLIHAALPNARIIHTCRDPVDTCLSIFAILFAGQQQPYSYDLGELGRAYRAYEKMMTHWRNILSDGVMLEVRYEDVVDDFERQARRIIAHCGLEWDDRCLEFYNADRAVRTASHAQVRQPIYRSSIGRQRPPRELLRPLLEALGQS